jgi:hypothetical protein
MTDSIESPADDATVASARRGFHYGIPSAIVAVVAALLYAYVLWQAIGSLIGLPKILKSSTPWWLLILDVAVPVVVFVGVLLLGLRRRFLARALFFLIGATVVACSTVGSIAFVQTH